MFTDSSEKLHVGVAGYNIYVLHNVSENSWLKKKSTSKHYSRICKEDQLYIKKYSLTRAETYHTLHKILEASALGQKKENYRKRN